MLTAGDAAASVRALQPRLQTADAVRAGAPASKSTALLALGSKACVCAQGECIADGGVFRTPAGKTFDKAEALGFEVSGRPASSRTLGCLRVNVFAHFVGAPRRVLA